MFCFVYVKIFLNRIEIVLYLSFDLWHCWSSDLESEMEYKPRSSLIILHWIILVFAKLSKVYKKKRFKSSQICFGRRQVKGLTFCLFPLFVLCTYMLCYVFWCWENSRFQGWFWISNYVYLFLKFRTTIPFLTLYAEQIYNLLVNKLTE